MTNKQRRRRLFRWRWIRRHYRIRCEYCGGTEFALEAPTPYFAELPQLCSNCEQEYA